MCRALHSYITVLYASRHRMNWTGSECGCVVFGLVIRLRPAGVTYVYYTTDYDLISNWEDVVTKIGRADDIIIGLCFVTGDSCIARFDGMDSLVRHAEMELM